MKLTITLTKAEAEGIRKYLQEDEPLISKYDIERFVQGMVHGELQAQHSAVADYVRREEESNKSEA